MRRLLFMVLMTGGCAEPPVDVAHAIARGLEAGDVDGVLRHVRADYGDPVGDRAVLAADLSHLAAAFARRRIDFEDISAAEGLTARDTTVTGKLDAELVGDTTWRIVGPLSIDFVREDGWRARSGVLVHFRDIRRLMAQRRAALEGNDPAQMQPLLHPEYRDGDKDASEALAKLAEDLEGTRIRLSVTNYRLEVRGPVAHLDEHYVLKVDEQILAPRVARFTLARSAGRWRIRAGLFGDGEPR